MDSLRNIQAWRLALPSPSIRTLPPRPGDSRGPCPCLARRAARAGTATRILPTGHVSPRPWAGCSALLGEGAGAPPHPGAGRYPHHTLRRAPPCSPQTRRAHGRRTLGEPWGGPSPVLGRQVVGRRPEFVVPCSVCLSLTRPLGNRCADVHLGPVDSSRLTNGVRGRGPRIRGAPPGGRPPYGPAWRPFCAVTQAGLVRSAQRPRLQCV